MKRTYIPKSSASFSFPAKPCRQICEHQGRHEGMFIAQYFRDEVTCRELLLLPKNTKCYLLKWPGLEESQSIPKIYPRLTGQRETQPNNSKTCIAAEFAYSRNSCEYVCSLEFNFPCIKQSQLDLGQTQTVCSGWQVWMTCSSVH
jgi:hypothetical protein